MANISTFQLFLVAIILATYFVTVGAILLKTRSQPKRRVKKLKAKEEEVKKVEAPKSVEKKFPLVGVAKRMVEEKEEKLPAFVSLAEKMRQKAKEEEKEK